MYRYSLFAQRKAFHPYFSILFIGTVYFNWIVALGSLLASAFFFLDGIAIVIVLNVRWTLSHKNTPTQLTAKYQLAENIKTSKIVLPYIFFDTLLKIVDLSCTYLFSIDLVYVPENCQKQPVLYNTVFLAVLVFRHILVFAIPTTAVLWSSILRKRLRGLVVTLFGVRSRRIDTLLQKREFRNAIGQKVTLSASQDQYFNQLAGLW
ncbi:unnamed protein product, partial [Mesorhabditis spiculigera]